MVMPISERIRKAFHATRALGIPDEEVKPVLKQLLRVFDKNWEPIEAEDYRALIDAYFEMKENKDKDDKGAGMLEHDESERPSKKLHTGEQGDRSSSAMEKASQPCVMGRRINSGSRLPSKQFNDKGKNPILSHVTPRDGRSTVNKESPAVHLRQAPDKSGPSHRQGQIGPHSSQNTKLIKPKSECPTDHLKPILDSDPFLLCKKFHDKDKDPISSHGTAKDGRSVSEKASPAVHLRQPPDRRVSSHGQGEVVPYSSQNAKLIKPKSEHSIDHKEHFAKPVLDSDSLLPYKQWRDKGRVPISSHVTPSDGRSVSKKPKSSCSGQGEIVPYSGQNTRLMKQRSEHSIDHVSHSAKPVSRINSSETDRDETSNRPGRSRSSSRAKFQQKRVSHDRKMKTCISDITKGTENVQISLIDDVGEEDLPKFTYIPQNVVYQNAYVHVSLARIADEDCCSSCKGDCLSLSIPCACARETGGVFAYTPEGLLREEFLRACISMKEEPDKHPFVYCQDCPLERSKNEYLPAECKGHLVRKFIKECWRKCGCHTQCGNRVVQRGITCKLQVFVTPENKGWGLKTLQDLPKGTFVCEYVGEILTNTELYERNIRSSGNERHTYPVTLDADWGSEKILKDEEALCLDATSHGNVARFINHRCYDANLIDVPVEVETPDRHYYHLALFTARDVSASEELTWDYGIDFQDHDHPIKAFRCYCGSPFCRDVKKKRK